MPTLNNWKCEFCSRVFAQERGLINHSCEKKRRWFMRDQPQARYAFLAWSRFYELSMNSTGQKLKRSYKEFIDSNYYSSFYKFGKHITDLNAIDPKRFIDYVIRANIPINQWCNDTVYDQYVRELTKKESPEEALERNILLMQQWSQETSEPWTDFFRKISPGQAVLWLKRGRISPWVLYNVDSAIDLFDRCTPEQLSMIKEFAPIHSWKIKFSKNSDGVSFLRNTLSDAGL